MIGILLALQINNWNEERKLQNVEITILTEIMSDMTFAKIRVQSSRELSQKSVKKMKLLLDYIHSDLPYESKLDSAFGLLEYWGTPYLPTTAYETLKDKGMDIIGNDSIKNSITHIYTYVFPRIFQDNERTEWSFYESVSSQLINRYVRKDIDGRMAKPINFEALKKNEEFINMLHSLISFRQYGVDYFEVVENLLQKDIGRINKELNERKD